MAGRAAELDGGLKRVWVSERMSECQLGDSPFAQQMRIGSSTAQLADTPHACAGGPARTPASTSEMRSTWVRYTRCRHGSADGGSVLRGGMSQI